MKTLKILFFLLSISTINAQSLFKNTALVDEFGDRIDEIQMNVAMGNFSNSATSSSPLLVHTILEEIPDFKNLDEYKEFSKRQLKKLGYSEKKIKAALKHAEKSLKVTQNFNGNIKFELYEYKDLKVKVDGIKKGLISIKTSEGKKFRALLSSLSFRENAIIITGYKNMTTTPSGVKTLIKSGLYDWSQTEIYNEIVNSKDKIMVIITFDNSTYKFIMK